jgi:hypothetical protein
LKLGKGKIAGREKREIEGIVERKSCCFNSELSTTPAGRC